MESKIAIGLLSKDIPNERACLVIWEGGVLKFSINLSVGEVSHLYESLGDVLDVFIEEMEK